MRRFYQGDRAKYNGKNCTIREIVYDKQWNPISAKILYDGGKRIKTVPLSDLSDELRFLRGCDGFNHGYSHCQVYGLTRNELIDVLSQHYSDYEDVFLNGQEESDGSLTFTAYRTAPEDIVSLFTDRPDCFVFAWWHWDGDEFACSPYKKMAVSFDLLEQGDEPEWTIADITLIADDKYSFTLSAGDFESDEISFYKKLKTA